eukprot:TRINITY_DN9144_c0_g1_i1.p2 TRINITY_DN9144_c0_g1~~TRINITY_DN9144_c0_g1_i1.p2  ORF type:complete len:142 (+),score=30.04 TRINITY_DN9144_c0_g1_i1:51-428(+)
MAYLVDGTRASSSVAVVGTPTAQSPRSPRSSRELAVAHRSHLSPPQRCYHCPQHLGGCPLPTATPRALRPAEPPPPCETCGAAYQFKEDHRHQSWGYYHKEGGCDGCAPRPKQWWHAYRDPPFLT